MVTTLLLQYTVNFHKGASGQEKNLIKKLHMIINTECVNFVATFLCIAQLLMLFP